MNVTRVEIADAVGDAFDTCPANKDDLLAWATANRARVEVIHALQQLPEATYHAVRELWPHLSDLAR
ncbi:DUF2795 domain-containing protein [Phytoactinopolyspora halotolerans]|uniref:DUF2795 domain-containing protein n=1 Tax=Phytoactinopolyspora halotolerans TaxID=1981512 RepID=A0A6L9SFN7_9ACTN|nr:DUF2795 domain-containing protein [Phytoactinopolyspora halotolerans]NEE04195.1 DUF2795 domain-containing protein [Phytoactinopolyspora halotolerans]